MEVITRVLVDATAAQNARLRLWQQTGMSVKTELVKLGDKRVSSSQEHGDHREDKPDIDLSDSDKDVDIDDNFLDTFVNQTLNAAVQEHVDKVNYDRAIIATCTRERENEENLLDEFIRQSLSKVVRDMETSSNDETETWLNIPTDRMSMNENKGAGHQIVASLTADTCDPVKFTEQNVDDSGMNKSNIMVKDDFSINTKKRTMRTLTKILVRLGLKKKPRYRLQRCDISSPLPESLVIRGPDGELEDGLITMYIGDLLNHNESTQNESVSASSPCSDVKTALIQTKSENDISAHGASLPLTDKKSRNFIRRMFGDCVLSKKSPRNNNLITVY